MMVAINDQRTSRSGNVGRNCGHAFGLVLCHYVRVNLMNEYYDNPINYYLLGYEDCSSGAGYNPKHAKNRDYNRGWDDACYR